MCIYYAALQAQLQQIGTLQTIWTLKTRVGRKKSKKCIQWIIFYIKLTLQVWITHHEMLLFTSWWSYQVKLSNLLTSTRNQRKPASQFISVESMQLIKNLLWLSPSSSPTSIILKITTWRANLCTCVCAWVRPEECSEIDHLKISFSQWLGTEGNSIDFRIDSDVYPLHSRGLKLCVCVCANVLERCTVRMPRWRHRLIGVNQIKSGFIYIAHLKAIFGRAKVLYM